MYNILKKLGARPGDSEDHSTFTLPEHEHIGIKEAAMKIADHFTSISREYPPLKEESLPERVKLKITNPEEKSKVPYLFEHDVFRLICQANKPKSGIPGDLPRKLISEFSPELSVPVTKIFNNILKSSKTGAAEWPLSWKKEYGVPLQKKPNPQSVDDLRIISLTAFFSKVFGKFVVQWLLKFIGHKIDPKQFGGIKGTSISHYLIEVVNFILYNQDFNLPIAILGCAVDFSKAFNRQNHNILITKLSDMDVPGWLINIVIGFLQNRTMMLRYKDEITPESPLPGGCPQGTLLGLLLFLVLINDCGFKEKTNDVGKMITKPRRKFLPVSLHTKFVDDLFLLEAFNLDEVLVQSNNCVLPLPFHGRTGQKLDPKFS